MDSDTVNPSVDVPELPSATVAPATDTVGSVGATSSLVMVPVAVAVPRAAPDGFASFTVSVSSDSTAVSPVTETFNFWEVTPGAKVRVPEAAV